MQVTLMEQLPDIKTALVAAINEQTGGTEVSSAMLAAIDKILADAVENGDALPDDLVEQITDQYNAAFSQIPYNIRNMIENIDDDAIQSAYASLFNKLAAGEVSMEDFTTAIRTITSQNLQPTIEEFEALSDKITGLTATD